MSRLLTPHARSVLARAGVVAGDLGEPHPHTEHILLAIYREAACLAAQVLLRLGVEDEDVHFELFKIRMMSSGALGNTVAQGTHTGLVVAYGQREARRLRHTYLGTEHLLLGLLRASDGLAARALMNIGLSIGPVRDEIRTVLRGALPRM